MNQEKTIAEAEKQIEDLKATIKKLREPEDLKPGDICEVTTSDGDKHLKYFNRYVDGMPTFVQWKENVDGLMGIRHKHYTKIGLGFKAYIGTDETSGSWCLIDINDKGEKPFKSKRGWERNGLEGVYIGQSYNGQTFSDGLKEVRV